MKLFLGIDTSCYTTSCALVDEQLRVVQSARKLLEVERGERGLRQSEAVFAHIKQFPDVLAQALHGVDGREVAAVCVSDKPVPEEDSYMPVFKVGTSLAKSLALVWGVPCYMTSHQEGHLTAAHIGGAQTEETDYLALHLSGGTTDLLRVVHGRKPEVIGGSADLHAGQLVDRIGVRMGLGFPAGPELEKLAVRGKAAGRYAAAVQGTQIHLSGAETRALDDIASGELAREDVAAEVFDSLSRSILKMLCAAAEATGCKDVLIFGGVASSTRLRSMLTERSKARRTGLRLAFGKPQYSGDNAAGVAIIGAKKYLNNK